MKTLLDALPLGLLMVTMSFCTQNRAQNTQYTPARQQPAIKDTIHLGSPGNAARLANASIPPHTAPFAYGVNTGYYNDSWSDRALAQIAFHAGARTTRLYLPDEFLEKYGMDIRIPEFKYYSENLGLTDLTLFVGAPSPAHRDMKKFRGSDESSWSFKGLYEPSWLPDGQINVKNTYADYIYRVYQKYGKHISYWEVWNEPDFSDDWGVATDTSQNGRNWFNAPPEPKDLKNLKCPIFYYIRMLRVTYEVIKKLNPKQLIATGGIGYESFLYNILKYTDNPDGGKVTDAYPLRGGAYFEVLSFHEYPFYYLKKWNEGENKMDFFRHSDAAAQKFFEKKAKLEGMLQKAGYNGKTYPSKYVICTETNVPARTLDKKDNEDEVGSEAEQRNYIMKVLVQAQQMNLLQLYIYQLGQSEDPGKSQDVYELMGLYKNLKRHAPGQETLTESGIGFKTCSDLLYGYKFDEPATRAMHVDGQAFGAAFKKDDRLVYVLWAPTTLDKCECSKSVIAHPEFLKSGTWVRKEWDYSRSKQEQVQPATELHLGSSPVFLTTKK